MLLGECSAVGGAGFEEMNNVSDKHLPSGRMAVVLAQKGRRTLGKANVHEHIARQRGCEWP